MTKSDPEQEKYRRIIYRAVESDELDYKGPMNWNELSKPGKGKLVRHCLALANTKGGFIVIGVREDASGKPAVYLGLTEKEARSFDPSPVGMFINRCADPPIDFTIERPVVDGKRYAVFCVRPFKDLPHVCTNGIDIELQTGVFYIRTVDASSRPAHRAIEMQNLIQRAMRNQREVLGRMLRGILYENRQEQPTGDAAFEELRRTSERYFNTRRAGSAPANAFRVELVLYPAKYEPERFTISELKDALQQSAGEMAGNFLTSNELPQAYAANVSVRSLPDGELCMKQLFRCAMFHAIELLPRENDVFPMAEFSGFLRQAFRFFGKLYSNLGYTDEMLTIKFRLDNCENTGILCAGKTYACRIPQIRIEFQRSAADLATGDRDHAEKLLREFAERFNVPGDLLTRAVNGRN